MRTKDRLCAALKRAVEEPDPEPEVIEAPAHQRGMDDTPQPDEIQSDDDPGEILTEDGEDENRLAPTEKDWRMLGGFTGLNFRRLMSDRRDLNPLECTLEIYRESPSFQAGRAITCGHLAEYNSDWPFPKFNVLLCEVGKRYGGGRYSFRVYDSNHSLIRGRILPIAGDAKNPAPLPEQQADDAERGQVMFMEPPGGNGSSGDEPPEDRTEADNFEDIAKREEQMARIAALRKQRIDMERSSYEPPREPATPPPLLTAIEAMSAKLDDKGSDRNNGLALVLATMQQSQAQMMDSLKMVIAGIGDKLASERSSQTEMFKLLVQMSDSRSMAGAEIAKVQMEAKKSEMDLMLKMFGERREQQEMNLDKMLELLNMGMELKQGINRGGAEGEGEGGGEGDWLTKAISGLTTIISQQAMGGSKIPEVNPEPAELPAPDPEQQKQFIEAAAARAAATIAKKAHARQAQLRLKLAAQRARARAAPAAPAAPPPAPAPAPMDPETYKRAVMHQVLAIVHAELDAPPKLSAAVKFALQRAPADWKATMLRTDDARELGAYFRPYCEDALIQAIGAKLAGSEPKQQWLMLQAGTLRAYLQRLAQPKPPAPPPTEEVVEVDESELEAGVEPIPDENSVEVEKEGAL